MDYANDWKLQVDFEDRKLVFPPNICATSLRPDIVISSALTRNVILLELTCCAEEGIDAAQLRKENTLCRVDDSFSWKLEQEV